MVVEMVEKKVVYLVVWKVLKMAAMKAGKKVVMKEIESAERKVASSGCLKVA